MNSEENRIPPSAHTIIIGAMKAGTTSLFEYLAGHPEISRACVKEPDFFSSHQGQNLDIEAYYDLFDFDPGQHRYTLEASTSYTKYPLEAQVPQNMCACGIIPKLIYLVRDPFDRIESHYNFACEKGWMTHSDPITEDHLIATSNYYLQLEQYHRHLSESDVLIIEFNDLVDKPAQVVLRVCRFLEIMKWTPPTFGVHNSTQYRPTSELRLRQYIPQDLRLMLRRAIPQSVKHAVRRLLTSTTSTAQRRLTDEERRYVRERLDRDMHKFMQTYDVDVSQWGFG